MRSALLLGFFIVGISTSAFGQLKPNVWVPECKVDKTTDKTGCYVQIMIDRRGKREDILSVGYVIATKVLGVIGPGDGTWARLRVDDNPSLELKNCARNFCTTLNTKAASAFIAQMRQGSTLLVEFVTVQSLLIGPEETSLRGFDTAYQAAVKMLGEK